MKRDDPVRLKLRAERTRANLSLEIVAGGISHVLRNNYHDTEEYRAIVEKINSELVPAIEAAEAADKAYEPFWPHRRIPRAGSRPNPKGKKRPAGKKP